MSASGEPFSGEVIVYETPEGEARVDVRLERETVWLTQRQMAELFDTSTDNVGLHLKNVFDEGELVEAATTEDYSVVQAEGRRHVRRAESGIITSTPSSRSATESTPSAEPCSASGRREPCGSICYAVSP